MYVQIYFLLHFRMLNNKIYFNLNFPEEILGSNKAHWMSPDNQRICYASFDDSRVPKYKFPYYGQAENIYSDIEAISYPKVC